jgi:hypothetical protein
VEGVPWQLAAIHAGDWLVKILLMAAVLAAGPGEDSRSEPMKRSIEEKILTQHPLGKRLNVSKRKYETVR